MRQETPGDSWIIAQKAWPLFRKSEISSQGQRQFAEDGVKKSVENLRDSLIMKTFSKGQFEYRYTDEKEQAVCEILTIESDSNSRGR
jgi:hypothetical protein